MAKITKKAMKKIAAAVQSAHYKVKAELKTTAIGDNEAILNPLTEQIMKIVRKQIGDTLADMSEKFDADKFKKAAQPTPVPGLKVETVNQK